ncbi:MAG: porin family protein [Telluria sp.]
MHKFVSAAAAAAAVISCTHAHAEDTRFYAGVTTGSSKASLENSAGERFSSTNHPIPLKVYGGVDLNKHFAIEAGYAGSTDKHEFDKRLVGGTAAPRLASQVAYVAVKGTMALGESFDVYGKAGVAYNRYEMVDVGASNFTISGTKAMAGVGIAYKVNDKLALTLDVEHYGRVREKQISLSQTRLQAGVKFSF